MRRAWIALALLLWPTLASAHVGHVILRAERYLKLDVSGRDARVIVSLTLGEEEGQRVLELADADGDGAVTAAESDAYLAQWGEGLATEVPVRVDGELQALTWGDGYLDPLGEVREVPVTVEMVARFELAGGEQTVRVEDRMVRREVFERTDVAFRVRDDAELLASGSTETPSEPILDLSYGPSFQQGEPVVLTTLLTTPLPEPTAGGLVLPIVAAFVVVLLGGGLMLSRRRAGKKTPD